MSSVYKASAYQNIFRRIYNQTYGNQKSNWEYFVLGLRVYQWLAEHDANYTNNLSYEEILAAIDEIFDIILSLLEMMKSPASLLPAVIYYANKFVSRTGIKHNQLFNLLLTSTIVTLKFWSESTPTNNRILADIFEFPVADINLMERRFLFGIDYQLQLSENQVETFMSKININPISPKSSLQSPSTATSSSSASSSQASSSSTSSTTIKCLEVSTGNGVYAPPSPTPANC
eukprot:gene8693-10213_t